MPETTTHRTMCRFCHAHCPLDYFMHRHFARVDDVFEFKRIAVVLVYLVGELFGIWPGRYEHAFELAARL